MYLRALRKETVMKAIATLSAQLIGFMLILIVLTRSLFWLIPIAVVVIVTVWLQMIADSMNSGNK